MGLMFGQLSENPLQKTRKSATSTNRRRKKPKKQVDASPPFQLANSVQKNFESSKPEIDITDSNVNLDNARQS